MSKTGITRAIFATGTSKWVSSSSAGSNSSQINWGVVGVGAMAAMVPTIERKRYVASGGQTWLQRNRANQNSWMNDYQSHSAQK